MLILYDSTWMTSLDYDVVIIGSGPAGATTARVCASSGLRVLLVDKRQELGAPVQCSGAVSRHALEETGVVISDEYIQEAIYGFGIYNQDGRSNVIDYRLLKPEEYGEGQGKKPLGYVVDRRRFDRFLMTMAEREGAEVWLKTEGLDYQPIDDHACKVRLRRFGDEVDVTCGVVVGADGLQSQVGKWAGLTTHIKITELASCLQYVVDGVKSDGLLEIITGHRWAPGGYAWVFPKGHGYAEIGLGVIRTQTDKNARWHLDHFIANSFFKQRFKLNRILEIQGGGVPLAAPLRTQYADQVLLVGDAARHVNPITGGGIHTALSGGVIAGRFLAGLLKNGKPTTAEYLSTYQESWMEQLGAKMWKLYREKTLIFKRMDVAQKDKELFETMSSYFHPESEYKKI